MERIGVYVCHCGTNIAGTVDVEGVARWAESLPGVVVARDYKFMCSSTGQELIEEDIKELGLTRVVVAACSPHLHEKTFRRACANAGLNPYLFQMANVREHISWTTEDKPAATDKVKAIVSGAVLNGAALGGHAEINIGSRNRSVTGGNRQIVVVGGSVVNGAALGTSSAVTLTPNSASNCCIVSGLI